MPTDPKDPTDEDVLDWLASLPLDDDLKPGEVEVVIPEPPQKRIGFSR